MPFWPTHDPQLSVSPGFVLLIAVVSSTIGAFIIVTTVLCPSWAILPAGIYAMIIGWDIDVSHLAFSAVYFLSSVLPQTYKNMGTRVGLVYSLGTMLFFFVMFCYIPLLLNLFRGNIRHQHLYPAHSYLIMKALMMMMARVYVYGPKEDDSVYAWLPFNYFASFIGLVLMMEGILLFKKFRILEMERNAIGLRRRVGYHHLPGEPVA